MEGLTLWHLKMVSSLTSEFCSDSNMYRFNRPSIANSRRCTSDIKPCQSNRLPSNYIIKTKWKQKLHHTIKMCVSKIPWILFNVFNFVKWNVKMYRKPFLISMVLCSLVVCYCRDGSLSSFSCIFFFWCLSQGVLLAGMMKLIQTQSKVSDGLLQSLSWCKCKSWLNLINKTVKLF